MKDRIVGAYLKDFVDQFGLAHLDESKAFEYFINHCVVSKYYPDSFDPESITVGGGGDLGLDGLAIVVNDHLVFSTESVDYLKRSLKRLDVQFLLVQAKTSAHFDAAEIGAFLSGVREFFELSLTDQANDRVRALHEIKEFVFDSSIDMDNSPTCRLYYATAGEWKADAVVVARADQGIEDLRRTGLFSAVDFTAIDSEALRRLLRELHHKIEREIVFDKHTILPQIDGVQEAYIGIVPCTEYLKLVRDDDGSLNKRLFYDNVRDFQGNNSVNQEMAATIRESQRSDRFALLNNGVTIVARDVNKVGTRFRLRDYQIVNGCQTSHIIFLNQNQLTPNVFVPLKLIVTTDVEVTNQVIQGTNRQTEVKLEAFESLAPFQKKLEELYLALGRGRDDALYYERRSKQYEHTAVRKDRIVTLATQINCFIAMFLNEPHSTHRYYGELLSSYRTRLFGESHSPWPYYLSAVALARVERLFAEGRLPRPWRVWKYELLMIYRLQNEPGKVPPVNSKAIEAYCQVLLAQLDDPGQSEEAFGAAGRLLESGRAGYRSNRERPDRTRAFTLELVQAASSDTGADPATTERVSGVVKWFSDIRGYGFIVLDDGEEAFIHHSGIVGPGYRSLQEGQRVELVPRETDRGMQAVDVEVIGDASSG